MDTCKHNEMDFTEIENLHTISITYNCHPANLSVPMSSLSCGMGLCFTRNGACESERRVFAMEKKYLNKHRLTMDVFFLFRILLVQRYDYHLEKE